MNEIVNKYVAKYAELVIPWVLTSGVKIIFIIIGTLIQIIKLSQVLFKSGANRGPT
jgi:hypothetical protein